MNKEGYIKELKKGLKCDLNFATRISDLLENNFLFGKKNKEKIIYSFVKELNVSREYANNIYDISMNVATREVKYKLKHPFSNLDKI